MKQLKKINLVIKVLLKLTKTFTLYVESYYKIFKQTIISAFSTKILLIYFSNILFYKPELITGKVLSIKKYNKCNIISDFNFENCSSKKAASKDCFKLTKKLIYSNVLLNQQKW